MTYYCRHCGERILPCRCVAHDPPMWKHAVSKYHRCGTDGLGETLAEPDDQGAWRHALAERHAQQRRDRFRKAKPSLGPGMVRKHQEGS